MAVLTLHVKAEYFFGIKNGSKTEEYRLTTPYWRKRIEGKTFDGVELVLGYPKGDDHSRRLLKPWNGYTTKTITHKHFGANPVEVFAIDVR